MDEHMLWPMLNCMTFISMAMHELIRIIYVQSKPIFDSMCDDFAYLCSQSGGNSHSGSIEGNM